MSGAGTPGGLVAQDPGTPPRSPKAASPANPIERTRDALKDPAAKEEHVEQHHTPAQAASAQGPLGQPQQQMQWDPGTGETPSSQHTPPPPSHQQQRPAAAAQHLQQPQQQQQQQAQGGGAPAPPGPEQQLQDPAAAALAHLRALSAEVGGIEQLGALLERLRAGEQAAGPVAPPPQQVAPPPAVAAPVARPGQQAAATAATAAAAESPTGLFAMSARVSMLPRGSPAPAAVETSQQQQQQEEGEAMEEEDIIEYQPPRHSSRGSVGGAAALVPPVTSRQTAAATPAVPQPVAAAAPPPPTRPPAAAAAAQGTPPTGPAAAGSTASPAPLVLGVPQPVGNWQRNPCGAVFVLLDCKDQHSFRPGAHAVLGVYRCGNEAGSRDYCAQHRLHPLYLVLRDQSLSPIDTRQRLAPLLGVAQVTFVEEQEPRDLERKLAAAEAARVPLSLRLQTSLAAGSASAAAAAAGTNRAEVAVTDEVPSTPSAAGSGVRRGVPSDITSSSSGAASSSSAAAKGKPPSLLLLRLHKAAEGGAGVTREDVYLTRPVLSSYTGTPCSGVTLFTGEPRLKGSLCGNEASTRGRCRRHKLPITLIDAHLNSTSVSSLSELAEQLGLVRVELLTAQGEPVEGYQEGSLGSWEFVAASGGGRALRLTLPPPVGNYQTKACSAVEFTVKSAPGWAAGGWQGPGPPPLVSVNTCGNEAGNRRSCRSHTSLWQVSMLPAATPAAQLMEVKALAAFKTDSLPDLAAYLGVKEVVIADVAPSTPAAPSAATAAAAPSASGKAPAVAPQQQPDQPQEPKQPPGTSNAAPGAARPLQGITPSSASERGGPGTSSSPRSGPPSTAGALAGGAGSPGGGDGSSSRPGSSAEPVEHPAAGVVLRGGELWLPVDPRPLGPWQNNACRALYILLDVPEGETYTVGRAYPILAVERCGNEAGMRSRCRPHNEGAFALVNTQQQPLTRAVQSLQELSALMGLTKVHLYTSGGPLVDLKSEHPACADWSPSNANGTAAKVPWGYSGSGATTPAAGAALAAAAAAAAVAAQRPPAASGAVAGGAMVPPAAAAGAGMGASAAWVPSTGPSVMPGRVSPGYQHPGAQQDLLQQQQQQQQQQQLASTVGAGMYSSGGGVVLPSYSQPMGPPLVFTHSVAAPFAAMFEQQQQQVGVTDAALASYNTMLPAALQAVTQAALGSVQPLDSSTLGDPSGVLYSSSGQVSPAAPFLHQQQQQQQAGAQGPFLPAWALQAAAAAAAASEDMDTPMAAACSAMQGGWQY